MASGLSRCYQGLHEPAKTKRVGVCTAPVSSIERLHSIRGKQHDFQTRRLFLMRQSAAYAAQFQIQTFLAPSDSRTVPVQIVHDGHPSRAWNGSHAGASEHYLQTESHTLTTMISFVGFFRQPLSGTFSIIGAASAMSSPTFAQERPLQPMGFAPANH